MVCPNKQILPRFFRGLILIGFFLLTAVSLLGETTHAATNKYFDFGPYYNQPQVLGFSLSSLENLPALNLPDNLNLPKAGGILPDSPFYTFEKIVENTQLTFTFDPIRKEELRLNIAAERLSEAKTLMEQSKTAAASQALDDYGKTLTAIAEDLPTITGQNNPQAKDLVSKIEEAASAQTVVATALSLSSSPAQAENWTEAINTGRQVLDKVSEVKGEPVIPDNLSASLQQLKEQGLLSDEESNKLYNLKNRSQVREELNKLSSSGQIPPSEIAKLDEAVERYYPEIQKQQMTNLQVVELRAYQALPQPSGKVVEDLQKWQENPQTPPSNDIKPYLWYNRAQDLAKEVNLSDFSDQQQNELVKFYPKALAENPTYSPPPSPAPVSSPAPSASPVSTDPGSAPAGGAPVSTSIQPATTAAQPSAAPSPTPPAAEPYLVDAEEPLPGQPTYIIKQLGEGLSFALALDPAEKARIKMQQAERRLAEATSLSGDAGKISLYESTLKDYKQAISDASKIVKELQDPKAAKKVAEKLEAQAARHEVVFEKGLLPTPQKNPKLISDAIETAEDAMDRSADRLERPALPNVLASRLGDLKAQGLILPEEAEGLVNSASREEARSKIRKLLELKTFPLADAKKLDEAQTFTSPADYNQLVEVRKVEELQNLRAAQTDLAQTPTLRSAATTLGQKEAVLTGSIDPTLIKPEDLKGRDDLVKTYQKLAAAPRPINGGQFGPEATPGAQNADITPPKPADAVLSACPEGAVFKQFEGCVWADTGKKINDYEQYKCDGPRQYYSFAARKCVAYDNTAGFSDDAQPVCPVGYTWNWQAQSCQAFTGGGPLPLPSPSAEPEPVDENEIAERSKSCPEGSSYKPPKGCVWDESGKSVYDSNQYRCGEQGQYYSFEKQKCVAAPRQGEPYPKDTTPACKEPNTYWSWSAGKCMPPVEPISQGNTGAPGAVIIDEIRPTFLTPDNPFYFLKQIGERAQRLTAFTPAARGQVSLAQAQERLAEAVDALKKNNGQGVNKALDSYTAMMQNLVSDLSKEQLTQMAKNEIGKRLSQEAVEQNLLLQKLSALAPQTQDTAINAAVSASILGVDKAADFAGEPPIPPDIKAKIEALPEKMIAEEEKKKLLEAGSRVEARLSLGGLVTNGGLTQKDIIFLNEDFDKTDPLTKIKVEELKKLEEITTVTKTREETIEKVQKNEDIAQKLQEFEKTFEEGQEVPAEIRPFVRLTRINEVAQTIRPDIVRLDDFQNRKDIVLAVATLQEEFRPTKEAIKQVEEFRRRNPGAALPPELARVEALSYGLGVRVEAGPCFLPTPPFPANTPCPPPGAAIPIASYYASGTGFGSGATSAAGYGSPGAPSTDKDGKPLVYGQGPQTTSPGVCPSGYHWMYDSGGWCMSNSGNYSSSSYSSYAPSGSGPNYTPYSPYYNAPGAYPATSGYQGGYSYSPPSYYGTAPTYYTTTPPSGTVPGSGPKPTAPGQCPAGFHWMSDSGGWCMANAPTYVPGGPPSSYYPGGTTTSETQPPGGYNCGSQPYDPVTKKCKDGACPGGFNWDGSKCVAGGYSGGNYNYSYSTSSYESCQPGYYWTGSGCVINPGANASSCPSGYSWNGYLCQPTSGTTYSGYGSQACTYPAGGCGYNSYWDYGSCSCRSATTYTGGSGPSPSNSCQGLSCGGGSYLDYSTCSCKYSSYSGPSGSSCSPPSGGCGSGWFDYGSCSCKTASSQGCYNVSASSCGSGWYFDSAACTCRQSSTTSSTTSSSGGGTTSGSCPSGSHWMSDNGGYCMSDAGGSSTTTSGGSSSGSCPSGYHWMSDNGGWCMQDGAGSTSPSPSPSSTTTTSSEPTPAPSTAPSTESTPPPSTAPAESTAPASSPSP